MRETVKLKGKYIKPGTNFKLYIKVTKKYLQNIISSLSLPANSEALTHISREI